MHMHKILASLTLNHWPALMGYFVYNNVDNLSLCYKSLSCCKIHINIGLLAMFLTSVTPVALQYTTLAFGNILKIAFNDL